MYKFGIILIGFMWGVGCLWIEKSTITDREARIKTVAAEYCVKYRHCATRKHPASLSESPGEHLIAVRRSLIRKAERSSNLGQDNSDLKTAIRKIDGALSHKPNFELTY